MLSLSVYIASTTEATVDAYNIGGFKNSWYRERLLRLNAETLELRRLKSDLTLMYRTVYWHCGLKFASFIHRVTVT